MYGLSGKLLIITGALLVLNLHGVYFNSFQTTKRGTPTKANLPAEQLFSLKGLICIEFQSCFMQIISHNSRNLNSHQN